MNEQLGKHFFVKYEIYRIDGSTIYPADRALSVLYLRYFSTVRYQILSSTRFYRVTDP